MCVHMLKLLTVLKTSVTMGTWTTVLYAYVAFVHVCVNLHCAKPQILKGPGSLVHSHVREMEM